MGMCKSGWVCGGVGGYVGMGRYVGVGWVCAGVGGYVGE